MGKVLGPDGAPVPEYPDGMPGAPDKEKINRAVGPEPTPEEVKQLESLEALMVQPKIRELGGLLLLVWRQYFVIRDRLIKEGVSETQIHWLMHAMTQAALEPFNVNEMMKDIKRDMITYLRGTPMKWCEPKNSIPQGAEMMTTEEFNKAMKDKKEDSVEEAEGSDA